MPSPGQITAYEEPIGEGIRVDSGFKTGDTVSVYYDPMIAKLIACGENRAEAVARLRAAVDAFRIEGVRTNLPFLAALLDSDDFRAARVHTRYVDEHLSTLMASVTS
jgi:acetyl-CoA carboxylase biotin carboxylase subunit